nr:NADH dehydrogenase subunit 6 [Haplotrema minimum]
MFKLVLSLLMVLSFLIIVQSSPMMLSLIMLMNSVLIAFLMSITYSVWFSYVFFLVYVGGLLVLLIYIVMISSNVKLMFGFKGFYWWVSMVFILLMMVFSVVVELKVSSFNSVSESLINFPPIMLMYLGVLLLIMFLGISNIVFIGGGSLKIGVN